MKQFNQCLRLFHFPSAFNSSPVLPPCLRRRSEISECSYLMASSRGVLFSKSLVFKSAPASISNLTITDLPVFAAPWRGVLSHFAIALTSAPLSINIIATSFCPFSAAKCNGVSKKESVLALTSAPSANSCLTSSILPSSAASYKEVPHPTSNTDVIVISSCFISLQLSILHTSCRRVCGGSRPPLLFQSY